jgi:DHA1 family bicyclomycin/chloramphenicol resistance-like MFS transporter
VKDKNAILIILGSLMAVSPFSIDMYLSSFPDIAVSLRTDVAHVGYSLTSYFVGVCIGQLIYGILIDRYGRKLPLIVGLAVYLLSCIGCALAPTLNTLILFRFIMALGGCAGLVASRAIVRDLFPSDEMAKVLSQLILVMAVAPIVAPSIGSFVNELLGWRWVFGTLAVIALTIIIAVIIGLPETKDADASVSTKLNKIWQEYSVVFRNIAFIKYSLCGGIGYAGMFAYIAGSPFVFMEVFELSSTQYAGAFAFNAVGLILGSQLNRIALDKFQVESVLKWSSLALFTCACVLMIAILTGTAEIWSMLLLTFFFLFCLGFLNPNAQALALRPLTKAAGRGSAILGSIQMTAAALASWAVSFLANGTTVIMPTVMLVCAFLTTGLVLVPVASNERVAYDR